MADVPPRPTTWDHKEPRTIANHELRSVPYRISSALHRAAGTPPCPATRGGLCAMCGTAYRLVVEAAGPLILEAAVTKMAAALGARNIDLHPRCADDIA